MRNPQEEKGFVLTLDATLAVLVVLAALVGVARVGSSPVGSEEYNRLERDRIAEDALRVLSYDGVLQEAQRLMDNGESGKASQILRENLRDLLPDRLQFRVDLGDELEVYPTVETGWSDIYDNLANVSTITSVRPGAGEEGTYDYSDMTDFHVLGLLDDSRDEEFMVDIRDDDDPGPEWTILNQDEFLDEVGDNDDLYEYDAIFLPGNDFLGSYENRLDWIHEYARSNRLVIGQEFFQQALREAGENYIGKFEDLFGIDWDKDNPPSQDDYVVFQDLDHFMFRGLGVDRVPYPNGKGIEEFSLDGANELAVWESDGGHDGQPAITLNPTEGDKAIAFGARYRPLLTDISDEEYERWREITKRAIYDEPFGFETINLHVWRGNEVESS